MLTGHFCQGSENWLPSVLKQLSRFLLPLRDTLIRIQVASAPYNPVIHDMTLEMQRTQKTYWARTMDIWSVFICSTASALRSLAARRQTMPLSGLMR